MSAITLNCSIKKIPTNDTKKHEIFCHGGTHIVVPMGREATPQRLAGKHRVLTILFLPQIYPKGMPIVH
jgi:hypothetical protein